MDFELVYQHCLNEHKNKIQKNDYTESAEFIVLSCGVSGLKELGERIKDNPNHDLIMDEVNEYIRNRFVFMDDVIYSKDEETLIKYDPKKRDLIFEIPESVKNILYSAFEGNVFLRTVKFPKHLKNVGLKAFKNCTSLRFLYVNNELESCGSYAFDGCISLEKVYVPGVNAFKNCKFGVYASPFDFGFAELYCGEDTIDTIDINQKTSKNTLLAYSNCRSIKIVRVSKELEDKINDISILFKKARIVLYVEE